jgi:endoglucanase
MLNTLKQVLAVSGVSGNEHNIAKTIEELIGPYVSTIKTDVLGNLIAIKEGKSGGKRVMIAAHMDQIGYVVTDIDDKGFLYVTNVGGFGPEAFLGKVVTFTDGLQGVVSSKEPSRGPGAGKITMEDVYIDIGASSREDAAAKVKLGDMACVAYQLVVNGNRVSAPTMDDRAACAVLIEALKAASDPVKTIIAVFTSQEEVGIRGAAVSAFAEQPDEGIAVDVTLAGDTPDAKPRMAVSLGKGPAIKIMDRASISTPYLRDALIKICEDSGMAYQREVLPFGGTDAGAIQRARAGIPAVTISIPCRYVHSPVETVDLADLDDCVKLILGYVNT